MNIISKVRVGVAALLLASSFAVGPASAEDRHVRIINETTHTMVRFYASNTGASSWEEDILGNSIVKPGDDVVVNIDDGTGHCLYDFKAVFDDGDSLVRARVNVCEISSYRYTE